MKWFLWWKRSKIEKFHNSHTHMLHMASKYLINTKHVACPVSLDLLFNQKYFPQMRFNAEKNEKKNHLTIWLLSYPQELTLFSNHIILHFSFHDMVHTLGIIVVVVTVDLYHERKCVTFLFGIRLIYCRNNSGKEGDGLQKIKKWIFFILIIVFLMLFWIGVGRYRGLL